MKKNMYKKTFEFLQEKISEYNQNDNVCPPYRFTAALIIHVAIAMCSDIEYHFEGVNFFDLNVKHVEFTCNNVNYQIKIRYSFQKDDSKEFEVLGNLSHNNEHDRRYCFFGHE